MSEIRLLFSQPEIIVFVWIGAICGHILSFYKKDFQGTMPFFKKLMPKKSSSFYHRLDFLLIPVIGTILALVLIEPSNIKASMFAGVSWSGTITALIGIKEKEEYSA